VHIKIACIGTKTKAFLEDDLQFPINFMPVEYNGKSFAREFLETYTHNSDLLEPLQVLIPRSSIADHEINEDLEQENTVKVHQVDAYQTKVDYSSNELLTELEQHFEQDTQQSNTTKIFFTSASCVHNFLELVDINLLTKYRASIRLFTLGPKTHQAVKDSKLADFKAEQAESSELSSLVKLI
jgi:uroporphyrinogen-III synthase